MKLFLKAFGESILILTVFVIFGLLMAFPIMWCWNYSVAVIWTLSPISWGQAWCLMFLSTILLKPSPQGKN